MGDRFTNDAETAIKFAENIATKFGHDFVRTDHLLYGILKVGDTISSILKNNGITESYLLEAINKDVFKSEYPIGFSKYAKKVLENSYLEFKRLRSNSIGTGHLTLGMLCVKKCEAYKILETYGVNFERIRLEVKQELQQYASNQSPVSKIKEAIILVILIVAEIIAFIGILYILRKSPIIGMLLCCFFVSCLLASKYIIFRKS